MDDVAEKTLQRGGFVQHVLNFDDSTKKYLMNTTQYMLTALAPIIILNKVLEDLLNEFDDSKGNFELLAEVALHLVSLIAGMFLTHRVVTYLPSYSGIPYENINMFSIILTMILTLYNTQSNLGFKMKLLGERVGELWNGKEKENFVKSKKQDAPVVKTNMLAPPMPTNEGSRADYLMNHDQMTSTSQNTQLNNVGKNDPYGEQPNNQFSGLIEEPMAANGVLGSAW
jgi:hypothetical protein